MSSSPWYKKGLHFECTGCGKCCKGSPGYVWVDEEEIIEISQFLNLSVDEFSQKYLRKVGKRYSLIEWPKKEYACVFLKDNRCEIYPVRPKQCKTYPFWPDLLKSKKNWEEEAKACEGISEKAEKVSYEEIEQRKF